MSENEITPQQFVDAMNHVIPGDLFILLGDRWQQARDKFLYLIKNRLLPIRHDPLMYDEILRTSQYTYTVRVEAVDNYMARTYRELTVVVVDASPVSPLPAAAAHRLPAAAGILYRLDGTTVAPGTVTAPGICIYRDAVTGRMVKSVLIP